MVLINDGSPFFWKPQTGDSKISTAAIIYSMFFWESQKKMRDVTSEHGGLKFKGTRMGVQIYK